MPRSYFKIYLHLIWTVKNREPLLSLDIEQSVTDIIKMKAEKYKANVIAIGNTDDHIHLLVSTHPDTVISAMIKEMKAASSYYVNHDLGKLLYWQDTYGALSVSKIGLEKVREYVISQKKYHLQNNTFRSFEISNDDTNPIVG